MMDSFNTKEGHVIHFPDGPALIHTRPCIRKQVSCSRNKHCTGTLSTAQKTCSSSTYCPFIKALTKCLSSPVWVEGCFIEHGSNHKEIYSEGITSGAVEAQGALMQCTDAWAGTRRSPLLRAMWVSLQTGFHVLCSPERICRRRKVWLLVSLRLLWHNTEI